MIKNIAYKLKHIIPWFVAAGIFYYMFYLYPPADVWKAIGLVNLPLFSGFAVFYFLSMYFIDAFAIKEVISKFSHKVTMKDILIARGVTYLVMVINYPASQAAFAYYLKRRYNIDVFKVLGIFIFMLMIDLFWLVTLALVGSFFQDYMIQGVSVSRVIKIASIILYVLMFLWILYWRRWPDKLFSKKIKIPIIDKLRQRSIFHVFSEAHLVDYLKLAVMRAPYLLMILNSMYISMFMFDVKIPYLKILGNLPIIFFVGALPITPGGLGTTNIMAVELLHPFLTGPGLANGSIKPQDIIFGFTICWEFFNYAIKVIVGSVLLHFVSRSLFKPTPDVPEILAEHEATHFGGNY